ncbi:uncharacterized protein PITG_15711 [Phytophthora infestans T30-4]|uniref:Uncharacterized protein n=1 Tax=Phytophthora infestans (strain T30-4) TaxID=403677 RepID=D0NSD9_PHYIT|nr:uncharacterized protein PITG_15711 [Phytophthora infestans T30-4]EEY64484.1 conserved hypothetical protein [Phytophthora infestans T30-4]|eukprot:XP_002897987.1 conserved hypothetical protein [Phytophthora infestans T30-4]
MKIRGRRGTMSRQNERLYKQRRHLANEQRQQERSEDELKQQRERAQPEPRTMDWWSCGDEDDATELGSTHSSTNYGRLASGHGEEMMTNDFGRPRTDDRKPGGSQSMSTTHCSAPDGSWKTREMRKSCNRLRRTLYDDDDGQYELVNDRKNNTRTGAGVDVVAARLAAWTSGDGRIRWPIAAKETKDSRVKPGEQSLACVVEAAGTRSHEDSQIHTDLKGSHFRIGATRN